MFRVTTMSSRTIIIVVAESFVGFAVVIDHCTALLLCHCEE